MEKDHLEIILEDIDSKMTPVLECVTSLDQKIDSKFNEFKKDVGFLDFKIDTVNERIDSLDSKLSKRIDNVEITLSNKIDAVATDLKAHRNDTEAHQIYRVKEG